MAFGRHDGDFGEGLLKEKFHSSGVWQSWGYLDHPRPITLRRQLTLTLPFRSGVVFSIALCARKVKLRNIFTTRVVLVGLGEVRSDLSARDNVA